jgi:sec-independent protein translocase protein TatA
MGALSTWHLLILGAIALLLFGGKGKISDLMGDLGRGVTSFKKGLADPTPGDRDEITAAPAVESEVKDINRA